MDVDGVQSERASTHGWRWDRFSVGGCSGETAGHLGVITLCLVSPRLLSGRCTAVRVYACPLHVYAVLELPWFYVWRLGVRRMWYAMHAICAQVRQVS